ncbi:MAG TPA: metal-dependent transcriptional regulator, partial [Clostridiaceae bacterium]|nr:metal-dependent transcriptional regulator [Clostridiaceae bacterium]
YLETILILLNEQTRVRSVDVAAEMGYSRPTISIMMKQLREQELIEVDESGFISLTASGQKIAERVYERHVLLTDLLISLGVDKMTAGEDACKIEHVISKETFARVKDFYQEHLK